MEQASMVEFDLSLSTVTFIQTGRQGGRIAEKVWPKSETF